MKGAKSIKFQGTVATRADASGRLTAPGDAILIERERMRWLLLSCPCGCGEEFPINLDPRAGPAWRLYGNKDSGFTLFPSVWRETGCHSHYVIWRNKIYLFGRSEDEFQMFEESQDSLPLIEAVRQCLPEQGLVPFAEIADALDAIPWDVLMVCRRLTRLGFAQEGKGTHRGSFGKL